MEAVKKSATAEAPRQNMRLLEPEMLLLVDDKKHTLYDSRVSDRLDEAFVLNIMYHGVIEPVVATKDAQGQTIVVDGRQRVKAALEANKRLVEQGKVPIRVPVILRRGDDTELLGAMISANEQRREDSVMNRAAKAAKLINMGRTQEEAGVVFGVNKSTVCGWLKLLELAPEVRKAVSTEKISVSAAMQLHGLAPEKQVEALDSVNAIDGTLGKEKKPRRHNGKPTAREVAKAAGVSKPRMRSRKEIEERLMVKNLPPDYRSALRWVLGGGE